MIAILKALGLVLAILAPMFVLHVRQNRRWRICDACRLDKETGRSVCYIPHSCSKTHAGYVAPDGSGRASFGKRVASRPTYPRAVLTGKRRDSAPFKRQDRSVVVFKARS